jgi:Rhamnan synthesis protein F
VLRKVDSSSKSRFLAEAKSETEKPETTRDAESGSLNIASVVQLDYGLAAKPKQKRRGPAAGGKRAKTIKPRLVVHLDPSPTDDLGSEVLRSGFERATKRINSLTEDIKRLETTVAIRARELSTLQKFAARMKNENIELDRRVGELVRENEALRVADSQKVRQIGSLVRSTNRLQNEMFWSVFHFIAGANEFDAYAQSVGYDLPRLFSLLLTAEIQDASNISPEIQAHAAAISNIFDPFFYLTEYQDIARDGVNPLLHYVTHGHRERRQPTRLFDTIYYLQMAKLGAGDPLMHYVNKGAELGLKPHPLFDGNYYRQRYPDVANGKLNPLFHYQTWGGRERRDPSPMFDTEYFLKSRNLPTIVDNPLHAYLTSITENSVDPHPLFLSSYFCGQAELASLDEPPLVIYEKRADLHALIKPHPLFDLYFMRRRLGIDFPKDKSPIETFCRLSREQDIDPSVLFDSKLYRYQVEVEKGRPLADPPIIDYLKRGYEDKTLLPNIVFDPQTYRERNSIEFSGPELTHYCLAGDRAGYITHPLFNVKFYNEGRTDDVSRVTAIEHFLLSEPNQRHVSYPTAGRPLLPEMLEFVRRIYADDDECDPVIYRQIYPDLFGLNEAEAKTHFEEHGRQEGRVASSRALVRKCNLLVRDLPLGFFPDEYIQLNSDLAAAGLRPEFFPAFGHYILYGRAENRTIGKWQFYLDAIDLRIPTLASPMSLDADAERIDVCVLMHLFYPDLWPELAAFARNFESVTRDVFVNIVDIAWTPDFQRELRELCPGAFVQLSNDNGRDIGGFIRLLDNVDISKYDLFAFMHSKKSPHIAAEKGDYWRRCLLRAFAGTPEIVSQCVQMFKDDPSVGLIGAAEWRETEMGNNHAQFDRMIDLFQIEQQYRSVEYLSGTMFLIRSEVVQRIYDVLKGVNWEYGGGKDVAFHMDGQAAHAVERVVGNLVRQMGYRMVWR